LLGAHPFPLIRVGGLFLLLVGLSITVGAVAPRRLWASFIAGVIIASAVVALTTHRLTAPLGKPPSFQIEILIVAVFIDGPLKAGIGGTMFWYAPGLLGERVRAARR
jgi:hypothetical protein